MTRPTESELEVLQCIWANGASTVRQVNDLLNKKRDVGYTTTLKIMQIMHAKGLLLREEQGALSPIYVECSGKGNSQQSAPAFCR